jgi:hypothetical protein
MKTIIKKMLREGLLDEGMLTSANLPKETALFSKNGKIYLSLYDPMTRKAYGMISASLRGQNYDMGNVAAEKGFGPYMYELAMMTANIKGKGLMPARDGDIRSEALDVWYKFYDRDNVKKQTIPPFDGSGNPNPEYSIAILSGDEDDSFDSPEEFQEWWDELNDAEQRVMKIFNSIYFMAPNQDYSNMLARGEEYIKKGINPERAFKAGQDLFMSKYD